MVILGLGSNCGDRLHYLRQAIQRLQPLGVIAISPLYESDALLPEGAPEDWNRPFLNLAVSCQTSLSPEHLLAETQAIEKQIGRTVRGRWAPREIDIDILAMGDLVIQQPHAPQFPTLPHPGLIHRPFAALPFADLAPDWRVPTAEAHFAHAFSQPISEWTRLWRLQPREQVPSRTHRSSHILCQIVGALNVTPDSFAEGDREWNTNSVFQKAKDLLKGGADILELGAEATSPGVSSVHPDEEWNRLAPLFVKIKEDSEFNHLFKGRISIDTRRPSVAARAIEWGATSISDVSGFESQGMQEILARGNAMGVVMHSLTIPADKTVFIPLSKNPISFLLEWGFKKIELLEKLGIPRSRMIFDPGIGFGKSREQDWAILKDIRQFHQLGVPLFVGHSRKFYLSLVTNLPPSQRDLETFSLSPYLISQGVNFLRVHNPAMLTRQLRTWAQIDGVTQCHA